LGKARIVGGIRPQNYDAAYRPDGPRVVYDSKTRNDRKSIGKNWQNMVNDLALKPVQFILDSHIVSLFSS